MHLNSVGRYCARCNDLKIRSHELGSFYFLNLFLFLRRVSFHHHLTFIISTHISSWSYYASSNTTSC